MVVAHAVDPNTQEAEAGGSLSVEGLVYRASSSTARAVKRNPVLKTKPKASIPINLLSQEHLKL